MSNILNTDFKDVMSQTVGFTFDDIAKIEPFKDNYSTAWFAMFSAFIGMVVLLIGIAFLYSFCDCVCSCCRRSGGGKSHGQNRVHSKGGTHRNPAYDDDY